MPDELKIWIGKQMHNIFFLTGEEIVQAKNLGIYLVSEHFKLFPPDYIIVLQGKY